ncbi:class II fumarate hydratase [Gilvimarinus sp. F26214L]|uniref:class II fumarate hydratase n=1 Tax=Gilvimarinus sp. DZF01 TaxID=3461371 RepID=UPI0040464FFF
MKSRQERDSLGTVEVPADALWGAQTQRSLQNFRIGGQQFGPEFIHAYAQVKKAAALTNQKLGKLDEPRCGYIVAACDEVIAGQHDSHFPLVVWQTGSGTQTNMNLNEVIANRANELSGSKRGSMAPVHPNDHVNMSQSSNDTFPTAMHVTVAQAVTGRLLPTVDALIAGLDEKANQFRDLLKSGRTHMMDATPVTLGQEFAAYGEQIRFAREGIETGLAAVYPLAIGGSAVGTGLNTHPRWATAVAAEIAKITGLPFTTAPNKFAALASHGALAALHGGLKLLATELLKVGNDLRYMASGPRCGLNEIQLPSNEPGSSIMPGKVNPTQIEALTMVAAQVFGNDTTVSFANSQGHFQLNVYKPVIIYNLLQSITLLNDAVRSFTDNCLLGVEANEERLSHYMESTLMLVTALTPCIGYDNAAKAAKLAFEHNLNLKQAVLQLELLTGEEFDRLMDPKAMLSP